MYMAKQQQTTAKKRELKRNAKKERAKLTASAIFWNINHVVTRRLLSPGINLRHPNSLGSSLGQHRDEQTILDYSTDDDNYWYLRKSRNSVFMLTA